MKKGGGKAKGGAFEREYAKKLSEWFTEGYYSDGLWRSAGSGAKAKVTNSTVMCGDLMPTRPECEPLTNTFTIELKNYKELDLLACNNSTFLLAKWWDQVLEDAQRARSIPLVIFRINRRADWAMYCHLEVEQFFKCMNSVYPVNTLGFNYKGIPLTIVPVDAFLDKLDVGKIKELDR